MTYEDLYFEIPTRKLIETKQKLKEMINCISQVQNNRSKLIEYNGYTDEQLKIKDEHINPELYNHFRMQDKGVEIIWTNCYYDTVTECVVRNGKKYAYAIRYYNCKSNLFKDKKADFPYCYENTSYGRFDNLDLAKVWFKRAVVDLLYQMGCTALNPYDFY